MRKVLVVEDNPDLQFLISRRLEMMGFTIVQANSGLEAVEKAIQEKPQLIFMDIMMPGMDGREATRLIRADAATCDIPILAATVLFQEEDLKSCIEAGCNDYIVKPFTLEELEEKIEALLHDPTSTSARKNS